MDSDIEKAKEAYFSVGIDSVTHKRRKSGFGRSVFDGEVIRL